MNHNIMNVWANNSALVELSRGGVHSLCTPCTKDDADDQDDDENDEDDENDDVFHPAQ